MNFFNLRTAINEAANAVKVETGVHEFFGGINESFNEFNLMMNESCADIDCDIRVGNEILIESVTGGVSADKCDIINESIFKNVIDKVKEFFKKIVEYIKGIIAKIKLYLAGHTKNTEKWMSKMKAAVKTAGANSAITKGFEWTGYEWNTEAINKLSGYAEEIGKISIPFGDKDKFSMSTADTTLKKIVTETEAYLKELNSDKPSVKAKDFAKAAEDKNTLAKRNDDSFAGVKDEIKKALGLVGNLDAYKTAFAEEAHGSKEKRILKGIDKKYEAMLVYIESCADYISKTSDFYDKLKDTYDKVLSILENTQLSDFTENENIDKDNKAAMTTVKDAFNIEITFFKKVTGYMQGITNGVCSLHISLTKDCAQEYMTVLTKLALAKPAK